MNWHVRQLFLLPICFMVFPSCAQEGTADSLPNVELLSYTIGSTNVAVQKTTFDTTAPFFTQLHDDETTAETATLQFLKQYGGTLFSIENNNKRYMSFSLSGRKYQFDPNRMFTKGGIRQSLNLFGSYTPAAAAAVGEFGAFVLNQLPDSAVIIAVHNNTENRFSVQRYKKGNGLANNAAAVHINPTHDPDDFFITTDSLLYEKLSAAGYNCVLQNETADDDGSLSIFLGRQKRSYVNVEAQVGHFDQQLQMLHALKDALKQD